MSKNDRSWIPDAVDLDWIESLRRPLPPALAAIEAAAEGRTASRSSIATRAGCCRSSPATGGGSSRSGRPIGYSTLWLALGQPADGTIVTIDPDRERTDLARGWWRQAGIADERITVVNAPALEAFGVAIRRWPGRSTSSSSTRSSPSTRRYLEALVRRLAPGALVVADNVLWSGRASGTRPAAADDANTAALRAFDTAVLADPRFKATILPVGDGLLIAAWRG